MDVGSRLEGVVGTVFSDVGGVRAVRLVSNYHEGVSGGTEEGVAN